MKKEKKKKNILIFMSDQHSPVISEFNGGPARTPNLNKIKQNGICFDSAYTSCPLCVPARMSFLTGRLPSKTGILNNFSILPDNIPTIANAFNAGGYETVLIGRMHFVGENQRHGFQHRLVGDITSPEWKPSKDIYKKMRGPFMDCFSEPGCTSLVGGGGSPVLQYDEEVIRATVEWLSLPHEKPQFIIVGTYGPHFPYVSPLDKYRYYLDKVKLPWGFEESPDFLDPTLKLRVEKATKDSQIAIRALAAYCGMIETIDEGVGRVREQFKEYCSKSKHNEGIFVYTSDHGDQCGERGLFAKMTFFENSVRIPLFFEGHGIEKGVVRKDPVSIVDLVPTLCKLTGLKEPPSQDGEDLFDSKLADDRTVISELYGIFGAPGRFPEVEHLNSVSRMVRNKQFKFITRYGFEDWDLLFDLKKDPEEKKNIIEEKPEIADELRANLCDLPSNDIVKQKIKENWEIYDFMQLSQIPSSQ
ncbi:MAG: sulfatase-like hydrolase/transferase, partial [Peptococcales bacterium]